ncbi:hypothetical protein OS493_010451 [Desmophyllum pertusum]|uniref:Uncharacterized protein n=1 Tax=Desmophyllum pertusum TaxID=174260 RepID=A0A9X0A3M7_9CNID|nr:hypothetical protein OS493_010451 [Desmophyllum pertusum]
MFKSRKGLEDNLSDTFYGNTCSPISKMERNKPLTTLMMGRLVKKSIAKAGFDEAQLSHRSYRSGFATRFIITCAIENGGRFETQQVEQLKRLGGWAEKSSVVHLYIKRIIEKYSDTCGLLNEGLRSGEEREECLRRIPTAYNYRLLPPSKNIAKEELVDPKKVNNSKQTATAKFCKEKNRRQHEERSAQPPGPPKPETSRTLDVTAILKKWTEEDLATDLHLDVRSRWIPLKGESTPRNFCAPSGDVRPRSHVGKNAQSTCKMQATQKRTMTEIGCAEVL